MDVYLGGVEKFILKLPLQQKKDLLFGAKTNVDTVTEEQHEKPDETLGLHYFDDAAAAAAADDDDDDDDDVSGTIAYTGVEDDDAELDAVDVLPRQVIDNVKARQDEAAAADASFFPAAAAAASTTAEWSLAPQFYRQLRDHPHKQVLRAYFSKHFLPFGISFVISIFLFTEHKPNTPFNDNYRPAHRGFHWRLNQHGTAAEWVGK